MATRRPSDYTPEALAERARPLTPDEEYDLVEDDLRVIPDGTGDVMPYHAGDENEPGNPWFGRPPEDEAEED